MLLNNAFIMNHHKHKERWIYGKVPQFSPPSHLQEDSSCSTCHVENVPKVC